MAGAKRFAIVTVLSSAGSGFIRGMQALTAACAMELATAGLTTMRKAAAS
jgi:hypothetical protein